MMIKKYIMVVIRNTSITIIKKDYGFNLKLSRERQLELAAVIENNNQKQAFNMLAKKGKFRKKDLLHLFYLSCLKQEFEVGDFTLLQKKIFAKIKKFSLSNRDLYHIYRAYMRDSYDNTKQDKILDVIQNFVK